MWYLLLENGEQALGVISGEFLLLTKENIQYYLFNKGTPYMYYAEVDKIDDDKINILSVEDIKDLELWDDYNFCKYVMETYKTKLYVRNEEALSIEKFPGVKKHKVNMRHKREYKLNEELWNRYIKTFNKDLSLRDQVLDMYKHFTVEECKEIYGHSRKLVENIYNEHGSKTYEGEFKEYLNSHGVYYGDDESYEFAIMYGEMSDEHCGLIHGMMYKSNVLIKDIIFSHMRYNEEDQLDYFQPIYGESDYDKDYYIQHHIIDGKICDIKVAYNIITYEEMLYIREMCK